MNGAIGAMTMGGAMAICWKLYSTLLSHLPRPQSIKGLSFHEKATILTLENTTPKVDHSQKQHDQGNKASHSRSRKRIAFSSNTRADWVKLEPLADILAENGFQVDVFVIGMHMVEEYGHTYKEITKHGKFGVYTRKTWSPGQSELDNATQTMKATAQLLGQNDYDMLIVHGDRLEAKAAADAAHLVGRCRLAHVEGGDLTGGDDNKNRYAITAMADYHFPSSQDAARRLLACGQRFDTIFTIGSPDLDVFLRPSPLLLPGPGPGLHVDNVRRKYNIPFADFGIAPFHPNSAESHAAGQQAADFYGALQASGRNFIIPRPNNDKGTADVQAVLDSLPQSRFCVVPNFEFHDYIVLVRAAGCVAGNSSLVVTSAPALGKLCLNIGNRQRGRTPPTHGLFNFSPHDARGILACLAQHWNATYPKNTYYGDGRAAVRFLDALSTNAFWNISQQKLLFDQKLA